MTVVTYHRPKKGCDASLIVMDDDKSNICERVARALHRLYDEECSAMSKQRTVFADNNSYVFENGLAFRFAEDAASASLEFLAEGEDKGALLSTIPALLQRTGLVEPEVAERLRKQIAGEGRRF